MPARRLLLLLIAACLLPLAGGCDEPVSENDPPPPPPPVNCPFCGEELPAGTDLRHRPLMVMIDNHPAARPQTGLTHACMVFEVLAEGGITRIVPVFVHGLPERVGPVRSARHYFLDLAVGLDALYTHAGQSPQAIVDLVKLRVADLNEFELEQAFWRDSVRKSPHNLYTSIPLLRSAAASRKGYRVTREETGSRWPYRCGVAGEQWEGEAGTGFEVTWPYSSGRNVVSFEWHAPAAPAGEGTDSGSGSDPGYYERSVNGQPHIDEETGEPLRATNVIVAYAKFWRIAGDTEGRLDADLTGTGRAVAYSSGRALEVTWRKAGRQSPLVFVDAAGELLWLPAGQTWILIVPRETQVKELEPAG
jgi:hypothetical protein